MASQNINVDVKVQIGDAQEAQTGLKLNFHCDQNATQEIKNKINNATGQTPNSNQAWIFIEGADAGELSAVAQEIGILGEPEFTAAGTGVWAKVTLSDVQVPLPPLAEHPLVNSAIPGETSIKVSLGTSLTLPDLLNFKQEKEVPFYYGAFQNFLISIEGRSNKTSVEAIFETLESALGLPSDISNFGKLFNALDTLKFSLNFDSINTVSPTDLKQLTSKDNGEFEGFVFGQLAPMIAQFGKFVENDLQVYVVLGESLYANIEIKVPGITNFAETVQNQ